MPAKRPTPRRRPQLRHAPASPATAPAGPSVAAADPLGIPQLRELPRVLHLVEDDGRPINRRADTDAVLHTEILRFQRAGFLRSTDSVEHVNETVSTISADEFVAGTGVDRVRRQRRPIAEQFLALGLERAFPGVPELPQIDVSADYCVSPAALTSLLDPNDGGYYDQKLSADAPWLVLTVGNGGHCYCPAGIFITHIEEKHRGFGSWFCHALRSPFTISPPTYIDWIGAAHWLHEHDESEAREHYEHDGETLESMGIPTRAQFDETYPEWARVPPQFSLAQHRRFLALAKRLLHVDLRPLFAGDTTRPAVDFHHLYRGHPYDAYRPPYFFLWKDADMVQHAVDQVCDEAANAGCFSPVAAIIRVHKIGPAAQRLADCWRVLTTFGQLADAIQRYRREHKLV